MKTLLLYLATAIAEIVGCYLPLLWLRGQGSGWLLLPVAAVSLATLVWSVDGVRPTSWDLAGVAVMLAGMAIIAYQPRT
jgi:small multidrug resistance family-3 protein